MTNHGTDREQGQALGPRDILQQWLRVYEHLLAPSAARCTIKLVKLVAACETQNRAANISGEYAR
jgi:hypothetical protein